MSASEPPHPDSFDFHPITLPPGTFSQRTPTSDPPVTMEYVHSSLYGARAVVLRKLLTARESEAIIEFMRRVKRDNPTWVAPAHPISTYRNNDRMKGMSEELSEVLTSRIRPFLASIGEDVLLVNKENKHMFLGNGIGMDVMDEDDDDDEAEATVGGSDGTDGSFLHLCREPRKAKRTTKEEEILMKAGAWKVDKLNPGFRLCRYDSGGHFAPHYDGDYVINPFSNRSLKTFMIYLNEDYSGGETNFIQDDAPVHFDEETGRSFAKEECIVARFKPQTGDAIIFDHKILHEGNLVSPLGKAPGDQGNNTASKGGIPNVTEKYIIRSDLMYKRLDIEELCAIAGGEGSSKSAKRRKMKIEAIELYIKGKKFEADGDPNEAVKLYSKAFRMYPALERIE